MNSEEKNKNQVVNLFRKSYHNFFAYFALSTPIIKEAHVYGYIYIKKRGTSSVSVV